MEPHAFIAEVYRRMGLRLRGGNAAPPSQAPTRSSIHLMAEEYASYLPADHAARILDLGCGNGCFMAACLELGYLNVEGADFDPAMKTHMSGWAVTLHAITSDIGEFLSAHQGQYDFIHLSHVIEHIPKYSLLWVVDAIYAALVKGGTVLIRTPNMEGPAALSCFYVTLAHEYGFAGSNLQSLLSICGFDRITFRDPVRPRTLKQVGGALFRRMFLYRARIVNRFFGVNRGGQFGTELIVTAERGGFPPLFDPKYR